MHSHLAPFELADLISRAGGTLVTDRQLARRLKELLPERLKQIEREYRRQHAPAKAQRLALNDRRYLDFLAQASDAQAAALESRITWETHRMLVEARRSIQAFHRSLSRQRTYEQSQWFASLPNS